MAMPIRRDVILLPFLLPSMAMAQSAGTAPRTVDAKPKVPLWVGFGNASGDDLAPLLKEDVAALSPIFTGVAVPRQGQMPLCHVFFLYAHLNADGTVPGTPPLVVREIPKLSGAAIVVLASPNPEDRIVKAAGGSGSPPANFVFTIDRKGSAFPTFFRSLFELMRNGEDMLMAWVRLAPQGPVTPPTLQPITMLVATAGKLAFQKPAAK